MLFTNFSSMILSDTSDTFENSVWIFSKDNCRNIVKNPSEDCLTYLRESQVPQKFIHWFLYNFLQHFCLNHLQEFKIPSRFPIFFKDFPRNSSNNFSNHSSMKFSREILRKYLWRIFWKHSRGISRENLRVISDETCVCSKYVLMNSYEGLWKNFWILHDFFS